MIDFELHITVRDSRPHKQERLTIAVQVAHEPGWQSLINKGKRCQTKFLLKRNLYSVQR